MLPFRCTWYYNYYRIFIETGDNIVKKALLLAFDLLMITSLLGGCIPTKTEEKSDEKVLQGNFVQK